MRNLDLYGLKKERVAPVNVAGRRERHGAPFNPSHGPPLNSKHGPPNLSLQYAAIPPRGNPPRRPPRPPSLNILSQPTNSPRPRTESRVKFAVDPPDRPLTHHRTHHRVHNSTADPISGASHGDSTPHFIHRKIPKRPATAPGGASNYQGHRVTQECSSFDLSEFSEHHIFPHLTSSTRLASDGKQTQVITKFVLSTDDSHSRSLQPPLLLRRRRPGPLAILPAATAHLPPSSLPSSTDSPPPVTPRSSIPVCDPIISNPGPNVGSRSPGRFRDIGPPVHNPPTTPLPSPPVAFNEAAHSSVFDGRKILRVARSTSSLRSIPEVRKTLSHPESHTSQTSPCLVS